MLTRTLKTERVKRRYARRCTGIQYWLESRKEAIQIPCVIPIPKLTNNSIEKNTSF